MLIQGEVIEQIPLDEITPFAPPGTIKGRSNILVLEQRGDRRRNYLYEIHVFQVCGICYIRKMISLHIL